MKETLYIVVNSMKAMKKWVWGEMVTYMRKKLI